MPPVVSVVIPVFNAEPYVDDCLASIAAQTIGFDAIEVIAVDDGSTDGGGATLDEWAARHPNVRVFHQPNSGAPGAPRNRGIDASTGEYLFFADPDDHLGPEAFQRMLDMARRNDSDIVLGRIKGVGRVAPTRPFRRNVERGDVFSTEAVWSLTAQKLYRRSLIVDNGLRFAEGVRLGEEQPLVVPAYFLAKVISVVADYDCYYLMRRPGIAHLTLQVPDPEQFSAIVRGAVGTVIEYTPPGPERTRMLARWGEIEVLRKFGRRFPTLPAAVREGYARRFAEILTDFLPPEVFAARPALERVRAALIRRGRTEELVRLARFGETGERGPAVVEDGLVYAGYPYFRDAALGIPDDCYDITGLLALDHCRVEVANTPHGELTVRWHPAVPALREPSLSWSLVFTMAAGAEAGEERCHDAEGRTATVDLSGLPDGRWLAHSRVSDGIRRATLAIGAQGTAKHHPGLGPALAGDRPIDVSLAEGVLVVTVGEAVRPRAEALTASWTRGRLTLTLLAPWPIAGGPTLYLTRGAGGPELAVPAVQQPGGPAPAVAVRVEFDLRSLARAGLTRGRWQCTVGPPGAPAGKRGPVRAAEGFGTAITRSPVAAPLWSLAWLEPTGSGRAVTLVIADWRHIARRVVVRGRRVVGRLAGRS